MGSWVHKPLILTQELMPKKTANTSTSKYLERWSNNYLLKVNASTRTILVTFFLRVILRFIFQLETILKTILSENSCQIENSPQNSLQAKNEPQNNPLSK